MSDILHNELQTIISNEQIGIRNSFTGNQVIFPIIEIIRSLDYNTFMLSHDLKNAKSVMRYEKYRFGWSLAFKIFYQDLVFENEPMLFKFNQNERDWVDSIIFHASSLQITNQFLQYTKANLTALTSSVPNEFTFWYLTSNPGIEQYEKISISFYHSIVAKTIEDKSKSIIEKIPKIRASLWNIVSIYNKSFICYKASKEIDEFYQELSYIFMTTTQIFDDFAEDDFFNGISYKDYIDIVQYFFKAAIMHRDCCMALAEKTLHKIYLKDILTYCHAKTPFLKSLSEWIGWEIPKLENVISCLTMNKENYNYILAYPGSPSAPLFEIGHNVLMRSVYGCMDMPIMFLNRELKRKYPNDYFIAVNKREKRFREQLYSLFNDSRFLLINDNIEIKIDGRHTDIDAVIFDKLTNRLALFQLKWQDTFSTSITERFSRISNLIPKSVEWIDKVEYWIQNSTNSDLLKNLKITPTHSHIQDIYLFVIARNHVHFTNQILDERAVWASWYQIVEAEANVKNANSENPLGAFAAKLKFYYPENRTQKDPLQKAQDYSFKFSKYQINIFNKSE
ncbi:MAG: hypothetical protein JWQ63_1511 [Mucilaginibacter sp.]|nr:hypothetical protein [Mucilaginibacter sp.]